jgi:hypothetical protein
MVKPNLSRENIQLKEEIQQQHTSTHRPKEKIQKSEKQLLKIVATVAD